MQQLAGHTWPTVNLNIDSLQQVSSSTAKVSPKFQEPLE
jgi:hypothetical protein